MAPKRRPMSAAPMKSGGGKRRKKMTLEMGSSTTPPVGPPKGGDWLPLAGAHSLPSKWATALKDALCAATFVSLRGFLRKQADAGHEIFPPANEVFSAFHVCDLNKVRVVIIGQDPYHDDGQAHGLAFSVKKSLKKFPPSLKNVFKEVHDDPKVPRTVATPPHGCLEHWARQGVLLLNTCLTVRAHEANSHQKQGWEQFTDAVVRVLNEHSSGLVFLLWGTPAIKKAASVSSVKHSIIKASHPSPLSAARACGDDPAFLGSRCFSRCNEALLKRKRGPAIDWTIPA